MTYVLSFLLGGALVFGAGKLRSTTQPANSTLDEVHEARTAVAQRLDVAYSRLQRQLEGFSSAAAVDREFSMKLLVEQERTAAEITEFAGRYMSAMDLDLLDIADSSWQLLSSGHFPASAGNLIADKAELPANRPLFFVDNIKGESILTLQLSKVFSIADLRFHAVGGLIVDSDFLQALAPGSSVRLAIKYGDRILSADKIESISELKDNLVLVNNTEYLADTLALPGGVGGAGSAVLMVLLEKPGSGR